MPNDPSTIAGSVLSAAWAADIKPARTVLLVDDSPDLLDLLAEVLQTAGFSVLKAPSGVEALNAYLSKPEIDAVVLDLNMPDLDGAMLAERFKFHRPLLPIVMFSGAERIPREALRHVDALVQKGQSADRLLTVLGEVLPAR